MQKHALSHMDHGFTAEQWSHIFEKYADKTAFFVDTFELPEGLGTVTDELYGPSAGDAPVPESEVYYDRRGDRTWVSRLVRLAKKPTRLVRVIAGPHEEHPCILYTAYGVSKLDMAAAPKEPGDLMQERVKLIDAIRATTPDAPGRDKLNDRYYQIDRDIEASQAFWRLHALATGAA